MLLTCPNCRSGLEVPDGTSALVRCPACKTVFAPADGVPPEEDEDDEEEEEEDEGPRRKARARGRGAADEDANRDFDPPDEDEERRRKRKPRHRPGDDALGPEEKAARRRAFDRAAWGARLICASFGLYMFSMLLVTGFFFQSAFVVPSGAIVTFAGLLGVLNWLLAAVGVGLCLSGPAAPGHWGYGIAAAVATLVHLVLLTVVVGQGKEFGIGRAEAEGGSVRWDMIPTRQNVTMFYLTAVVYPDEQGVTPKGPMGVSMVIGVVEMVRMVLILMLLSCLARAALDEPLAHTCTRAAGIASAGPGMLAVLIFAFFAVVIETNAGMNTFTQILIATVNMGVYSVVNGVMIPAYLAAREVGDACDEPFQSLIPEL